MNWIQIGSAVRAPSSLSPSGRSWSKPTHRPGATREAMDEARRDAITAVREHRVAGRDVQGRRLQGAEREREIVRHGARIEAEARDVVDRGADAEILENADRHQVARAHQRLAQARRPAERAGGVLGPPGLLAPV